MLTPMLAIGSAGWTVIGVLLTAFFTAGVLAVAVIAHLHDRALSGTKGALRVRPLPKSAIPVKGVLIQPTGWSRQNIYYFGIELHNRGPFTFEAVIHTEEFKCGFLSKRLTAQQSFQLGSNGKITLYQHTPQQAWILVQGSDGWKKSEHATHKLTSFRVNSGGGDMKFRHRVWMRPLPNEYLNG